MDQVISGARLIQDGDDQVLLLPLEEGSGIGTKVLVERSEDKITITRAMIESETQ